MKFLLGFTLCFLALSAILLLIAQHTETKPDSWTLAQMVLASLMVAKISIMENKK